MSTLHALNVGSGEAFLLETTVDDRAWTLLVDSGKRTRGNPHPLALAINNTSPGISRLDVCVCTHQDSDHAAGFSTFAEAWIAAGNEIGEFWLPGRWGTAVKGLLINPARTVYYIARGAVIAAEIIAEEEVDVALTSSEDWDVAGEVIRRRLGPEVIANSREYQVGEDGRFDQDPLASLGLSEDEVDKVVTERETYAYLEPLFLAVRPATSATVLSLLAVAIEAAESIRRIALSALTHKIPIRWFDFGQFEDGRTPSGGEPGLLEPINSVELLRPPVSDRPDVLFASLFLSSQNVESLVFLRPEIGGEPAALFLGDSRLAFGEIPPLRSFAIHAQAPQREVIVTAPHHGTRQNDHAYDVVNAWLSATGSTAKYLRNGGHWKQSLGTYKTMADKVCAQCQQCKGKGWSQPVQITSQNGSWVWPPQTGVTC